MVTACNESRTLGEICGCRLFLKFENLQFTSTFKERGALNRLQALSPEERKRGVIAMSAGNHAQGVAYHAKRLGIPATIVMPIGTPMVKIENTRRHGAEVIITGQTLEECFAFVSAHAAERGLILIHPYDDPLIIAGQGTIGLEMLAAVLAAPGRFAGRNVGLVLTGGNIDTRLIASVLTRELAREGRLTQLALDIVDRPGQLAAVSILLADAGANIIEVSHQRTFSDLPAKATLLELVIETRDRAHLEEVLARLGAEGFAVRES